MRFGALLEVEMSTSLWQEARLEVKMVKAHHSWSTFGSCAVEKVQVVVVRSIFRSQKAEKLSRSKHFWKLRCQEGERPSNGRGLLILARH